MKKLPLHSIWLVLIILASIPLSQVAIDLYLPSLPSMVSHLQTSTSKVQLSLTVYIFTLGLSQLIYGPLADRFGRRTVLIAGFTLFAISSLLCTFSNNIYLLLIARFFQGIGGGCGFVVSNAMMADLFSGIKLSRMITFGSLTWSLTPILAPALGGYIQSHFGWRVNFFLMLFYSVALLIIVFLFLPETLPTTQRLSLRPKPLIKAYIKTITNRTFIGLILCVSFAYGAIVAFNLLSPFILQKTLGISAEEYGLAVLLVGLAYAMSVYFNSILIRHRPLIRLIYLGLWGSVCAGLVLMIFSLFGWFTVTSVIIGSIVLQIAQGLIFPNSLASALNLYTQQKGLVSALFGCLVLLSSSIISAILSALPILGQFELGCTYFILSLIAFSGFYLITIKI